MPWHGSLEWVQQILKGYQRRTKTNEKDASTKEMGQSYLITCPLSGMPSNRKSLSILVLNIPGRRLRH